LQSKLRGAGTPPYKLISRRAESLHGPERSEYRGEQLRSKLRGRYEAGTPPETQSHDGGHALPLTRGGVNSCLGLQEVLKASRLVGTPALKRIVEKKCM
jgi:hypothetical protein